MSSASISAADNSGGGDDQHQEKVNSVNQIAMARLENEFRNILLGHTSPIKEDALIDNPSGAGSSSYHHAAGDGDSELGDEDRLSGGGGSGTVDESDLSLSDPIPRSGSSMSNSNSSSSYRTTSVLPLVGREVFDGHCRCSRRRGRRHRRRQDSGRYQQTEP
ncbi:hypothetical protein LINPERPRIM_LOCUS33290 [Linum perenne]